MMKLTENIQIASAIQLCTKIVMVLEPCLWTSKYLIRCRCLALIIYLEVPIGPSRHRYMNHHNYRLLKPILTQQISYPKLFILVRSKIIQELQVEGHHSLQAQGNQRHFIQNSLDFQMLFPKDARVRHLNRWKVLLCRKAHRILKY